MKRVVYEPGLLAVFRVYAAAWLIFSLVGVVTFGIVPGTRLQHLFPYPLLAVVESLFLLGYLSWPWLERKLGGAFLPIALIIATLGPMLEFIYGLNLSVGDELTSVRLLASQWQLALILFVPLIILSWQYNFRVVVGYTLFLAASDVALAGYFWQTALLSLPPDLSSSLQNNFLRISLFFLGPRLSVMVLRTFSYLLAGYAITRLVSEQRKQNAELSEANRQIALQNEELEQLTLTRERNRLAREMHDTLAHTLSALAVQLEAVSTLWNSDPGKAHEMLNGSLAMTRDGLNEARRAILALRTAPLDDLGFHLALTNLARSVSERSGLQLDLHVPEGNSGLSPQVEHGVYRIAEEALRNVAQHSRAKKLWVRVDDDGRYWSLTIRDDGLGFEPGVLHNGHYGLRGMRERAEALGGKLTIESHPDEGTTVRLILEDRHGARADL